MLVAHTRAMTNVAAPYFVENLGRKHVAERLNGDERSSRRRLPHYTTLDMRPQRAAESALRARSAGPAANACI